MNLSPETFIVSGDKSTLIMRPVFGEYYNIRTIWHVIYEIFGLIWVYSNTSASWVKYSVAVQQLFGANGILEGINLVGPVDICL